LCSCGEIGRLETDSDGWLNGAVSFLIRGSVSPFCAPRAERIGAVEVVVGPTVSELSRLKTALIIDGTLRPVTCLLVPNGVLFGVGVQMSAAWLDEAIYLCVAHSTGSGHGLREFTWREREILDLLAQARTSRQIADEVEISERTTDWPIRNVLGKGAAAFPLTTGCLGGAPPASADRDGPARAA
jgi:Bacterial regulatory proteins, luxR family